MFNLSAFLILISLPQPASESSTFVNLTQSSAFSKYGIVNGAVAFDLNTRLAKIILMYEPGKYAQPGDVEEFKIVSAGTSRNEIECDGQQVDHHCFIIRSERVVAGKTESLVIRKFSGRQVSTYIHSKSFSEIDYDGHSFDPSPMRFHVNAGEVIEMPYNQPGEKFLFAPLNRYQCKSAAGGSLRIFNVNPFETPKLDYAEWKVSSRGDSKFARVVLKEHHGLLHSWMLINGLDSESEFNLELRSDKVPQSGRLKFGEISTDVSCTPVAR